MFFRYYGGHLESMDIRAFQDGLIYNGNDCLKEAHTNTGQNCLLSARSKNPGK